MSVIPTFGRLKHKDSEFEGSLDYTERPCLKKKKKIGSPTISFKGIPSMTRRPPTRAHFLKVPPSPNSTILGTKPLTHLKLWEHSRSKLQQHYSYTIDANLRKGNLPSFQIKYAHWRKGVNVS
jgi:hypothetical protein